jgi:hypothetical protein
MNMQTVYNNSNKKIINVEDFQDYMFTSKNLIRFTKHIIKQSNNNKQSNNKTDSIKKFENKPRVNIENKPRVNIETIYKPKQKDSLFWCFYILKNGYSNYEMEINNQYFVIEKKEKFKYIEMIRNNKDILKLHKIKPFTELEDDLANKEKISVKTFIALCILENINILLVDKRKIFELTCIDITEQTPVHIIHRNSQTYEHHIELNVTNNILQNYREKYYKMSSFDTTLKSIGTYKLDELIDLCNKLHINISKNETDKKKKTKKEIYELLVLNY